MIDTPGMITLRRAGGRPSRKLALIAVVLSLAATVVTAQVPSPSRSSPQVRWGTGVLGLSSDWYGSDEARSLADTVIAYQSKEGGWPKDTDLSILPRPENPVGEGRANTIDNNATTLPMRFLARVVPARDDPRYRQSFIRGLEYLFGASTRGRNGALDFHDWWANDEITEKTAFEGFIDWAYARWQADVAACTGGDVSRCAAPTSPK